MTPKLSSNYFELRILIFLFNNGCCPSGKLSHVNSESHGNITSLLQLPSSVVTEVQPLKVITSSVVGGQQLG